MGRGPWIGAAAEEEEGGPANRDGATLDFPFFLSSPDCIFCWSHPTGSQSKGAPETHPVAISLARH